MYKLTFSGDPYEAGYKYGATSYKKNIRIKDVIELPEESYTFGEKCIAIYDKYYPEALEEIKGIAKGHKLRYEELAAHIFSRTSFSLGDKSFCFSIKDENNIILGRNSNLAEGLNDLYKTCFYNLHGGYSFIGNTALLVQMGDGINEWGLAVGLSPIYSKASNPGFNGGMLVRYILEKCKNTYEAVEMVKKLPIATSQGLLITDVSGDGVLLECNSEKVSERTFDIHEPFLLSANTFNNKAMKKYRSRGAEALILQNRYEELHIILRNSKANSIDLAFQFFSETHDFMEEFCKDKKYQTAWSSIYDLKNKRIYRAEGNPIKDKYKEDNRMKFPKNY